MQANRNQAEALLDGDTTELSKVATTLLKPLKNNLVERPWGGLSIRDFKRLCPLPDQAAVTGMGLGEAFELSAWNDDDEARAHPSRIRLADDSEISLPELLAAHGEALLGPAFVRRYGSALPLLPKILDIKELLSVQGHPEGNTEAYIVIAADPGATIRLGFSEDIDPVAFERELRAARQRQGDLLAACGDALEPIELQAALQSWLAGRDAPVSALSSSSLGRLVSSDEVAACLTELKRVYWRVLDSMNVVPVEPGQIIHNANPARVLAEGQSPSAEVHALGNPENREILALEIRRPGPTFRAWDNVRFPMREVDTAAAIGALNLNRTDVSEFVATPEPVPGREGVFCSIDSEAFRVEHLRPVEDQSVAVPARSPHCLHSIGGHARVIGQDGTELGELLQGESALVPIGVGAYTVTAIDSDTEVIAVSLPESS